VPYVHAPIDVLYRIGDKTLDIDVLNTGLLKGKRPLPPTVICQIEIINTSILKPLRPEIMQLLTELIGMEDHKYWFPVYLSIFVLLHRGEYSQSKPWLVKGLLLHLHQLQIWAILNYILLRHLMGQ
jgi:hypothetical protein